MEDGDPHGGAQDDFIFDDDDLNGIILLELQELRRLSLILELEQAQAQYQHREK